MSAPKSGETFTRKPGESSHMTDLSTHYVTERFSDMLRRKFGEFRSADKQIARTARSNATSARNWREGRNLPGFVPLIEMMRADDDVFDLVCRLADRPANRDLTPDERAAIEQAIAAMRRL